MLEFASDRRVPPEDIPSLLIVGASGVFSCALPERGEIVIGRSSACDVVVDDPSMSRRHLLLRTEGNGSIFAVDLGGTNGTSLDEIRLAPNVPTPVPLCATITAASTVIVVRTRAQASRACGLVSHAELRAQLIAECNRAGTTQQLGDAFALVKVHAPRERDAGAIEEALGGSLRRRDVVAAVTPGMYVALLSETSAERADAVASRMASMLSSRGVDAKLQVAVFPRDGDTPELLSRSRGTEPIPRDVRGALTSLVGEAPRALEPRMDATAAATANVLILGEPGAGKEVVARAIHARSARSGKPFLRVDAAALAGPELFEAARGGVLFLDEIGKMHPTLQAKLLDAIEERAPLGAAAAEALPVRDRGADVRIISATKYEIDGDHPQAPLHAALLQHLAGIRVVVPPLRARVDEIEPLAKAFVRAACLAIGRADDIRISPPAIALLKHHAWPRNVRELKEVIERAVLLASDVITLEHLPCDELAPVVSVRRVQRS